MEEYKDNWAEEDRKHIDDVLRRLKASQNFERILEELKNARWEVPRGFSKSSVREDRDGG